MTATCALDGCTEPVRNAQAMYCSEAHKRVVRAQRLRAAYKRERQQPPERTYELQNDPRVVIRPPVEVVRQPAPLPFTDDLNAALNHGSPGRLPLRQVNGYAQQWAGD